MAAFSYTGMAKFTRFDGSEEFKFIDYVAHRDCLSVWNKGEEKPFYTGTIRDYPCQEINFPIYGIPTDAF